MHNLLELHKCYSSSAANFPLEMLTVRFCRRPIAISLYHAYLHRWLEVFPREQILVVNGDLLIEDPVPQLRRIEKFLGLEHKIGKKNLKLKKSSKLLYKRLLLPNIIMNSLTKELQHC